jgi:hypothetical protein
LIDICVYLHRNYDFIEIFLLKLGESLDTNKEANKIKFIIKLIGKLYLRGVVLDLDLLFSSLNGFIKNDKKLSPSCTLISFFLKNFGNELTNFYDNVDSLERVSIFLIFERNLIHIYQKIS